MFSCIVFEVGRGLSGWLALSQISSASASADKEDKASPAAIRLSNSSSIKCLLLLGRPGKPVVAGIFSGLFGQPAGGEFPAATGSPVGHNLVACSPENSGSGLV